MFVRLRLRTWEDLEVESNIALPFKTKFRGPPGQVGFLEVYESQEMLIQEYPDTKPEQILEVSFVTKESTGGASA
jgi:hypothetical protein